MDVGGERGGPQPAALLATRWCEERLANPEGDHMTVTTLASECPFCRRVATHDDLLSEEDLCAAFYDTTPLNPGHVLVVPRRHETDFLALHSDELEAILVMTVDLRAHLGRHFSADGFNLGVNIGRAAGQTIGHAHLHLIPRYRGDVADPRGGLRWIIPERARYWSDDKDEVDEAAGEQLPADDRAAVVARRRYGRKEA